jgi:hypothetical protein
MAFKYGVKTKRSGLGNKTAKYYAVPIHSREISFEQCYSIC